MSVLHGGVLEGRCPASDHRSEFVSLAIYEQFFVKSDESWPLLLSASFGYMLKRRDAAHNIF